MADGGNAGDVGGRGRAASGPIFVKGFLPGLLLGLVVGLTLGALVPPLLDARAPRTLEGDRTELPAATSHEQEQRDGAFEGTGLPLDNQTSEDASDAGAGAVAPPPD